MMVVIVIINGTSGPGIAQAVNHRLFVIGGPVTILGQVIRNSWWAK
jgi:hypothetical protein